MESFTFLTGVIIIVFGILQIVLFFKLWGMTDDIKSIKNKYLESNSFDKKETEVIIKNFESKYEVGALVVDIKSRKQMKIKEITSDGKYSCYSTGGLVFEGNFDESEIQLFES
jgi:hypothetical protein